jgi:hypothetical protein
MQACSVAALMVGRYWLHCACFLVPSGSCSSTPTATATAALSKSQDGLDPSCQRQFIVRAGMTLFTVGPNVVAAARMKMWRSSGHTRWVMGVGHVW